MSFRPSVTITGLATSSGETATLVDVGGGSYALLTTTGQEGVLNDILDELKKIRELIEDEIVEKL